MPYNLNSQRALLKSKCTENEGVTNLHDDVKDVSGDESEVLENKKLYLRILLGCSTSVTISIRRGL